jgi:hypothetical protein
VTFEGVTGQDGSRITARKYQFLPPGTRIAYRRFDALVATTSVSEASVSLCPCQLHSEIAALIPELASTHHFHSLRLLTVFPTADLNSDPICLTFCPARCTRNRLTRAHSKTNRCSKETICPHNLPWLAQLWYFTRGLLGALRLFRLWR